MAEVIHTWPGARSPAPAQFEYPWEQWATLDENGHGDIWLATRGVDFPARMTAAGFRASLYSRAQRMSKMRKKNAPVRVMRVKGTDKVRRIPDYKPLRIKIQVVSDELVAFQFYDSPEPPPTPTTDEVVPTKRRVREPLHRPVVRRTYERVKVSA
ncbi:hypothetical protein SEA_ZUKO_66 [Streptomyces phage Zuko]|uniref:Uncharacterized protein n=1 Tax=Streptomyces phage Zuko TaxID=2601695 RepID=A0A5J6D750_9CAUD|nr:hypothetical protein PP630_gp066 [Streptomyces phage Zuko]QEQ93644.1 hypothetical protein SEA_ZUKO_66 [Streptomyces phage Zuko]